MPEIRRCVACTYERGFHVYFTTTDKGNKIGLICPQCGQSYDVGWITQDSLHKPFPGQKFF